MDISLKQLSTLLLEKATALSVTMQIDTFVKTAEKLLLRAILFLLPGSTPHTFFFGMQ